MPALKPLSILFPAGVYITRQEPLPSSPFPYVLSLMSPNTSSTPSIFKWLLSSQQPIPPPGIYTLHAIRLIDQSLATLRVKIPEKQTVDSKPFALVVDSQRLEERFLEAWEGDHVQIILVEASQGVTVSGQQAEIEGWLRLNPRNMTLIGVCCGEKAKGVNTN
jgi:hypothetical protein